MTQQAVQVIRKIEKLSKGIFWILLGIALLLVMSYMYFINRTIWNVATRAKVQDEIVAYSSKLGEIEFKYIKSKGEITLNSAKQLGFSEPEQVSFVTKETVKEVAMR